MIPSFSAAATAVTAASIKAVSVQAAKAPCVVHRELLRFYRGCFLIRNIFRSRGTKSFGDFTTTIFKMLIPFGLYYSDFII